MNRGRRRRRGRVARRQEVGAGHGFAERRSIGERQGHAAEIRSARGALVISIDLAMSQHGRWESLDATFAPGRVRNVK
jgi:hypothetical protein